MVGCRARTAARRGPGRHVLAALFLVVASIGFVFPSATAIALEGDPSTAGSASAFLGLTQFAIGAISAPLVGVAGQGTALPMAIVIVSCGLGAVAAFWLLVRPQTPLAAAEPGRRLMAKLSW